MENWQRLDAHSVRGIANLVKSIPVRRQLRIIYAAGPGDVISAYANWRSGTHHPSEVATTYSGQFADFCAAAGARALIVSSNSNRRAETDGLFTLEHRQKIGGAGGLAYHASQLLYGLYLLMRALQFRADFAVVHSDATHPFLLVLFPAFGVKVIPVLHNTLWPAGRPPTGLPQKVVAALNAAFFRRAAHATLCISPEAARQAGGCTHEMRCQFARTYFSGVAPPPPHGVRPFRVLFVGRAEPDKGIFDVLAIAKLVEERRPGEVQWEVCGGGSGLGELRSQSTEMGLDNCVAIRGWTSPDDLRATISRCHAYIVPTKGTFAEGFAKTAAEAILSGRPVITSAVVPALEVLRPACVEAKTDNLESYAASVTALLDDAAYYAKLCGACGPLQEQFFDKSMSFSAALRLATRPSAPST